jgi:hypothetical protein
MPWKLDTKRAFGIDMTIGTTGTQRMILYTKSNIRRLAVANHTGAGKINISNPLIDLDQGLLGFN